MFDKSFNDALIGNSSILVSINKYGNILRFFAPQIDYMQHIDEHRVGVVLNLQFFWLDDTNIFNHKQYYEENTNILITEIYNNSIGIIQKDYVDINNDVMVRHYEINKNIDNISNIKIVVYSNMNRNIDRFVSGWYNEELKALIQYSKDSYFATFSNSEPCDFQINYAMNGINSLSFNKSEYIGLSKDSAIVYNMEQVDEKVQLNIYFVVRDSMYLIKKLIEMFKIVEERAMYREAKEYWKNILSKVKTYSFKNDKEKEIYIRSIFTLLMYINDKTGGMIAGCEVDENIEKCGRYAYCWPRDAKMSADALNIVGLNKISEVFYSKFVRATQSDNGMWEQRFYTDCNIGPCWGSQIDETSAMVIGIIELYEINQDIKFIELLRETVENAIEYLLKQLDTQTNMHADSFDLWETFYGKDIYAYASIYRAFKVYVEKMNEPKNVGIVNVKLSKIYDNLLSKFVVDNRFVKGIDKNISDISILGLVWPFEIINPTDEKILNSVRAIEEKLETPVGGISRFENDGYLGQNPWIVATLWLAMYYMKKYEFTQNKEDLNKAIARYDWATEHSSNNGFLAEQISRDTGEPLWVNGLSWSHAMYIVLTEEIYGKKC